MQPYNPTNIVNTFLSRYSPHRRHDQPLLSASPSRSTSSLSAPPSLMDSNPKQAPLHAMTTSTPTPAPIQAAGSRAQTPTVNTGGGSAGGVLKFASLVARKDVPRRKSDTTAATNATQAGGGIVKATTAKTSPLTFHPVSFPARDQEQKPATSSTDRRPLPPPPPPPHSPTIPHQTPTAPTQQLSPETQTRLDNLAMQVSSSLSLLTRKLSTLHTRRAPLFTPIDPITLPLTQLLSQLPRSHACAARALRHSFPSASAAAHLATSLEQSLTELAFAVRHMVACELNDFHSAPEQAVYAARRDKWTGYGFAAECGGDVGLLAGEVGRLFPMSEGLRRAVGDVEMVVGMVVRVRVGHKKALVEAMEKGLEGGSGRGGVEMCVFLGEEWDV